MNKTMEKPVNSTSEKKGIPFLTVFTPTYNRAHTLADVYESLVTQTDRDFEWLIIDDGSSDNTQELVKSWITENRIPIRYIYQENGGKHIAYNHALKVADSTLFWPLDSDDLAVPNTVERLKFHWQKMQAEQSASKAIVFLYEGEGAARTPEFKQEIIEDHYPMLLYSGEVAGDMGFVFKLEELKKFKYPERWRRIYVPDSIMPYAISFQYKCRFINERLGVYRWNPNDIDRLSNFSRPEKLKNGGAASLFLQYWIVLNYGQRYFQRYPRKHLYFATQFHRFGILAGVGLRERLRWLAPVSVRMFSLLSLIPANIAAALTEMKYRKTMKSRGVS